MPLDLAHCDAEALHRCGSMARGAGGGHATLEAAARGLTRCFYNELEATGVDGHGRACALVRCYKTHPYGSLPPDLQQAARQHLLPGELATPGMRCVTLLASIGDAEEWNTRQNGGRHRAIPLPSVDAVARWPMLERLVADFGLEAEELLEPPPEVSRRRRGRNYGISHVVEALDSEVIPAQAELVRRHGVRSVIAFGGTLSTGDLFAIVLFLRVAVDAGVAAQFRTIALHVKSTLFGFSEQDVFDAPAAADDEQAIAV